MLMAGMGLDAHIVYHVNGAIKGAHRQTGILAGRLEPAGQAPGAIPRWRSAWSAASAPSHSLSKVRNYGGDFEIARNVNIMDDEFELVLLEGRNTLRYVKYFAGMALNVLAGMKGATVLRSGRVTLCGPEGSRIYVQIDGEFAGHLPAEVRMVPDALTLLIPPEYSHAARTPALARPGRSV